MASAADVVKRVLLGRQMASHRLEHTLLPKTLALPVFSSDPLSSVAYATQEMMIVLATAGAAAFSLMLPTALVIALVLGIVITSYRQTVRAYPRGGGSYIVAKENLGTVPGLFAASAILMDYILTVAVSTTAGVQAITSAAPGLLDQAVPLAVGFIVLISLANLRGVKEAGTLFAIPTYGFVACVYVTLGAGVLSCLGGCPNAPTASMHLEPEHGLTLFVILRAFASGSTALTGVEAIADGVQAFRRPQSRNAATTLAVMGAMSISMFIGITYLARSFDVRVDHHFIESGGRSVLAQIGQTVFGEGVMFYVLQGFTAGILLLAANTAYQDFPRLAAILARDRFMPTQFKNRGDRLVFSNGVVVLAVLAALLVWAFDANLNRLIQLYVVGVFTAFTLSQAGMVRRWLRTRETGWRRSAVINTIGALATGIVLVIVSITKFAGGAWIVIVAMPIIVVGLVGIHRHYERVRRQVRAKNLSPDVTVENTMLLLVPDLELAVRDAIAWLRAVRPERVLPLYIGSGSFEDVQRAYAEMAPRLGELQRLEPGEGSLAKALRRRIKELRGEDPDQERYVTVVIPETLTSHSMLQFVRRRSMLFLKARLLFERRVAVVDSPLLPEEGRDAVPLRDRVTELGRHVCLVPISAVHDPTVRAVRYARSLNPTHVEAVFLAAEPEEVGSILDQWHERGFDIPLSAVEAPFRDLQVPLLDEIRRHTSRPDTVVTVVLPEFVVRGLVGHLLHNQTALFIKRLLLFEPRVVVASVPSHLE